MKSFKGFEDICPGKLLVSAVYCPIMFKFLLYFFATVDGLFHSLLKSEAAEAI